MIDLFHVSRAPIKRYLKRRRETGNVEPQPIPGRTPKSGNAQMKRLNVDHAAMDELCQKPSFVAIAVNTTVNRMSVLSKLFQKCSSTNRDDELRLIAQTQSLQLF